jgi:hypothetical protein
MTHSPMVTHPDSKVNIFHITLKKKKKKKKKKDLVDVLLSLQAHPSSF